MKTTLSPTQTANQGYFQLEQCIYSPIAHQNEIDNYPGSDYISNNPKLKKIL